MPTSKRVLSIGTLTASLILTTVASGQTQALLPSFWDIAYAYHGMLLDESRHEIVLDIVLIEQIQDELLATLELEPGSSGTPTVALDATSAEGVLNGFQFSAEERILTKHALISHAIDHVAIDRDEYVWRFEAFVGKSLETLGANALQYRPAYRAFLESRQLVAIAAPSTASAGSAALSSTAADSAYVSDCIANGVPIPPSRLWPSSDWTFNGTLPCPLDFVAGCDHTSQIYTHSTSSGICYALATYSASACVSSPTCTEDASVISIICQSSTTGKACFFDNIKGNTTRTSDVKMNEVDNGLTLQETCPNCHRGRNAFIVHPGTPLDQPSRNPPVRYQPMGQAHWTNPPLSASLQGQLGSCAGCHGTTSDELAAPTWWYCGVLEAAANITMPQLNTPATWDCPTSTLAGPINALRGACSQGPANCWGRPTTFARNLSGWESAVSAAGRVVLSQTFDALAPGADISGTRIAPLTFDRRGSSLLVVKAADTFTPGGSASNRLPATSGANVLSPGGTSLSETGAVQQDDLVITFDEPVIAFGIDLLWQSADGFALTAIEVRDEFDRLIFAGAPQMTSTGGAGAAAGSDFWGIVSPSRLIAKVIIDESDDGFGNPDSNIGFDTIRYSAKPCGDGSVGAGEACDIAGNLGCQPGFECNACTTCTPDCGDGSIVSGEVCDTAGNVGCQAGYECNACTSCRSICGDGLIVGQEACDIAGDVGCQLGFGCNSSCTRCSTVCGDGLIVDREVCDTAGNVGCPTGVRCNSCTACGEPICGDGLVVGKEACDTAGDVGCPAGTWCDSCNGCLASCGDGVIAGREVCETDSNLGCPAGFSCSACRVCNPVCGDGLIVSGETCDGNSLPAGVPPGTRCNSSCRLSLASCGNGTVEPPWEICDRNTGSPGHPLRPGSRCLDCQFVAVPIPRTTMGLFGGGALLCLGLARLAPRRSRRRGARARAN